MPIFLNFQNRLSIKGLEFSLKLFIKEIKWVQEKNTILSVN